MDNWRSIPCSICGSAESEILFRSRLEERLVSGSYAISSHRVGQHPQLVRCRSCGLIYASPQPTDLAIYYASWKDDDSYLRETAARLETADRLLARLERHCPVGTLLDVGCATGILLLAAQLRGWRGIGVEPCIWAAQHAREAHGLSVVNGVLADTSLPANEFDAVTMVDVIEHLTAPADDLRRIHRALRGAGVLLVTTPDMGSWPARILRERWWAIIPTHVFYFSRESLSALLRKTGFGVVQMAHVGRMFSLGYWGGKVSSYSEPFGRLVPRILRDTGLSHRHMSLDLGDQLMAIAVKEE